VKLLNVCQSKKKRKVKKKNKNEEKNMFGKAKKKE
jgi:hypothetical protein